MCALTPMNFIKKCLTVAACNDSMLIQITLDMKNG